MKQVLLGTDIAPHPLSTILKSLVPSPSTSTEQKKEGLNQPKQKVILTMGNPNGRRLINDIDTKRLKLIEPQYKNGKQQTKTKKKVIRKPKKSKQKEQKKNDVEEVIKDGGMAAKNKNLKDEDMSDEFYEVESIKQMKCFERGKIRFNIKWKGWSESANTWEPFKNIRSCVSCIRTFFWIEKAKKLTEKDECWRIFVRNLRREKYLHRGKFKTDECLEIEGQIGFEYEGEEELRKGGGGGGREGEKELEDEEGDSMDEEADSSEQEVQEIGVKEEEDEEEDEEEEDDNLNADCGRNLTKEGLQSNDKANIDEINLSEDEEEDKDDDSAQSEDSAFNSKKPFKQRKRRSRKLLRFTTKKKFTLTRHNSQTSSVQARKRLQPQTYSASTSTMRQGTINEVFKLNLKQQQLKMEKEDVDESTKPYNRAFEFMQKKKLEQEGMSGQVSIAAAAVSAAMAAAAAAAAEVASAQIDFVRQMKGEEDETESVETTFGDESLPFLSDKHSQPNDTIKINNNMQSFWANTLQDSSDGAILPQEIPEVAVQLAQPIYSQDSLSVEVENPISVGKLSIESKPIISVDQLEVDEEYIQGNQMKEKTFTSLSIGKEMMEEEAAEEEEEEEKEEEDNINILHQRGQIKSFSSSSSSSSSSSKRTYTKKQSIQSSAQKKSTGMDEMTTSNSQVQSYISTLGEGSSSRYLNEKDFNEGKDSMSVPSTEFNEMISIDGGSRSTKELIKEQGQKRTTRKNDETTAASTQGICERMLSKSELESYYINELLTDKQRSQKDPFMKNKSVAEPEKSMYQLYTGNFHLKDQPISITAIDVHPFVKGQFIFKVSWKLLINKKEQLLQSWVEGEKFKQYYPKMLVEFYESYVRFID